MWKRKLEAVKFLWKRKRFNKRDRKRKQTRKRKTSRGAERGSIKNLTASTSLLQTQSIFIRVLFQVQVQPILACPSSSSSSLI